MIFSLTGRHAWLFSVNVHETNKASKFAYDIYYTGDGFYVDVSQGNSGSYVQGVAVVIRPLMNISRVCQVDMLMGAACTDTQLYGQCNLELPYDNFYYTSRQEIIDLTQIYSYMPANDEDYTVDFPCHPSFNPYPGNKNSKARLQHTYLIIDY